MDAGWWVLLTLLGGMMRSWLDFRIRRWKNTRGVDEYIHCVGIGYVA